MKKMKMSLMMVFLMLPAVAMAAPDVKIEVTAEQIVMVEENGKQVEKRVAAKEVVSGDVLAYTLNYKNQGDEVATGVVLNNPIPDSTVYIVGSAFGPGSEITFSIDGGKTYKKPSLLSYEVEVAGAKVKRKASPDQYTHIRWNVKTVDAGKSGMAGFRVRVK